MRMPVSAITSLAAIGLLIASAAQCRADSVVASANSSDIYNPDAYETVRGFDSSGTYVIINRGIRRWTETRDGKPDSEHDWDMAVRFVVRLEQRDSGEPFLISLCDGRDWGRLSSQGIKFTQSTRDNGRLSAKYEQRVSSFSTVLPTSESHNPLAVLPYFSPVNTPKDALSDVYVKGDFDLIRIGDATSSVGLADFSATLGGARISIANACWRQWHYTWSVRLADKSVASGMTGVFDNVVASDANLSKALEMSTVTHRVIGAKAGGVKPLTYWFHFRLDTDRGNSVYIDDSLDCCGKTGRTTRNVIRNDLSGFEVVGSVIPDGGKYFEKGSLPATYHITLSLH